MLDLVIKLLSQMEVCMILSETQSSLFTCSFLILKKRLLFFLAEKCFFLTVVFIYSYMSVCFRTGCSVQHVSLGNKWICNMYAFSLRFVLDLFSFFSSFISVFFFFLF